MKILGFDMATKTGWALIEDGQLAQCGLLKPEKLSKEDAGDVKDLIEDYRYLAVAVGMADLVSDKVLEYRPDYIWIEQTNAGSFRSTQKLLEFIHCVVLSKLSNIGYAPNVRYVDTSSWRSHLKIRMTKDDSKHNKLVKNKLAKGKLTAKHLAVRWANSTYNLNLLQKDHDIADSIAVATYGYERENTKPSQVTPDDLKKIFN